MTGLSFNPFESDKPRVLVVDDDADINRLLQVRLRNVGFAVTSAPDGETAMEMIWRDRPDMILLDISMPGISGLEVLDRIRKDELDVAVVMTTAFGSESIAIDALRRGADDYLRKPFEPGEFRAVIDRTLGRVHLRRQNQRLRQQLDAELKRAAELQQVLLPKDMPRIPGYEFAATSRPARDVSADFFDWHAAGDSRLTFTVGGVMGKGLPAAMMMTTVRSAFRPAMRLGHDPGSIVNVVAETLQDDLTRANSIVTLFVGVLDVEGHTLRWVDAGHGLAMHIREGGWYDPLGGTDVPFGIFPDPSYGWHEIALAPGDSLLVYSDGLLDSLDGQEAANMALKVADAPSAVQAVDSLIAHANEAGGWTDDVTIVVLRRLRDQGESMMSQQP